MDDEPKDFEPDDYQYAAGEFFYDEWLGFLKEVGATPQPPGGLHFRELPLVSQKAMAFAAVRFKRRYDCAG